MKHHLSFLALPLLFAGLADAAVTIDGGLTEAYSGPGATVQIPVQILGGDPITDMVGAVEIPGATITAVSYAGSVWESAPGGYVHPFPFPGFPPPGSQVDPNVSLLTPGEAVVANGILFTLTVDISALGVGDHPVKLSGTSGTGSTAVLLNGVAPPTTITNGTLRITKKPIDLWREMQFPGDIGDPAREASVWGDDADPDADGLKNLAEFALGLDPNDPVLPEAGAARTGVPQAVVVSEAGQDYLGLSFTRRVERPCHQITVEVSGDLQAWDPAAATVLTAPPVTLPGGQFELVTYRRVLPISPARAREFLRLRVTRIDP